MRSKRTVAPAIAVIDGVFSSEFADEAEKPLESADLCEKLIIMGMTFETFRAEISERLIEAAQTDRALPASKVWSADMRRFRPVITTDPHDGESWKPAEETGRPKVATAAEVSRWEECMSWVGSFVARSQDRRALWAWCRSRVGADSLATWSRREYLDKNTARRRADKALTEIARALAGKDVATLAKNGNYEVVTYIQ